MLNLINCYRYRRIRLSEEKLTDSQNRFVRDHSGSCATCAQMEARLGSDGSLPDIFHDRQRNNDQFADEILSEIRERRALGMAPWKPALIGAATAVLAMGTFLQVLTSEPEISRPRAAGAALNDPPKSKVTLFDTGTPEKPIKKTG